MSKFSEFLTFVEHMKPFCILITETWLKSDIPDSVCCLPGYKIFRSDRPDNRGFDGVCIYLHQESVQRFHVQEFSLNTPGIDNLFVTLKTPNISVTIGCIYRPRACAGDTALLDGLSLLSSVHSNLVIAGDFNMPGLKWPLRRIPAGSGILSQFAQMLVDSNLTQLIVAPTRYRTNQEPSLLDLLLTNSTDSIASIEQHAPIGKSDHCCITFKLQFITNFFPRMIYKQLARVDFSKLSDAIISLDWMLLFDQSSVETMWKIFLENVTVLSSRFTSFQRVSICPKKPWITKDLLQQISFKKALWQKFKRSGDPADYNNHRLFSNQLSLSMHRARTRYEDNISVSKNPKKFYKYVKSHLHAKVSIPSLHDSNGLPCSSNEQVANLFADFFSSVFTDEPSGTCPELSVPRNQLSLQSVHFDRQDVEDLLNGLDASTSPGSDKLSAITLKRCASAFSSPLFILFEASFNEGKLPQAWLDASVTPIFKKGDKFKAENYRPISIVPIVAKIAERIILDKMLPFLLDNNIIPSQQHGFISGRSVLTNLLSCLDNWTRFLDKKIPVDVLYLDFCKAFDKVPRLRLLHKLEHFGIRGQLLVWIQGFLGNRTFSVKIADAHSSKRIVSSGVPQGSVLGPVLFIVYTADLAALLKCKSAFYADDLKVFSPVNEASNQLQSDLLTVSQWCVDWLLPINASKCSVLHLGTSNPAVSYKLCGRSVKSVDIQNDLGVLITSNLSWSEHILNITKKANKQLYLIRKAFPKCSLQTLMQLFTTYVRPTLEHAGPAWFPIFVKDSELLESVQRRATRLPFGVFCPSYEVRLAMIDLPSFKKRRLRGDLIVSFRALHALFGTDMSFLFDLNDNTMRGHTFKLKKEKFNTTIRQKFLSNRVFDAWNALPASVVCAPSVNSFKNRLDCFWST